MEIEELQKKVIEFRDARDWEQTNQMTEDGAKAENGNQNLGASELWSPFRRNPESCGSSPPEAGSPAISLAGKPQSSRDRTKG
jgi:hypothetical protein